MAESSQLVHADSTLVLVESGALLVAVWWDAPRADQMNTVNRAASALRRRFPGKTGYAQFVIEGTPRFSSEVRKQAAEQTGAHAGLGTAHVIEIAGLAGAAARAFLSALMLLTQRDKPVRVFSDPRDAATWLSERLGGLEEGWSAKRVLELRQQAFSARP